MEASALWRYITYFCAAIVLAPILTVASSWLLPLSDHWQHIYDNLLGRLVFNSITLLGGVLGLSALLGVSLAWLTGMCRFPGRRFYSWAMLAPFAIPAYVIGFVYTGLFEFGGPVQRFATDILGLELALYGIRGYCGVVVVMALALYPYVYFIVRNGFVTTGSRAMEVGRSLGKKPLNVFLTVILPLSKPWIIGSLTLVGLEVLADFGTVSIFVYNTFTTAIYKAWFGFFSPETAAQLSSLLIGFVVIFFVIEQITRNKGQFATGGAHGARKDIILGPVAGGLACVYCGVVFSVGFLVPAIQLFYWAGAWLADFDWRMMELFLNSVVVAGSASLVVLFFCIIIVMAERFFSTKKLGIAARLATLGYAFPGSVLAVGVFLPLVRLDKIIGHYWEEVFGNPIGLVLTGTIFAMVLGLAIRFMAVAYSTLGNEVKRISPRLDEAALNFGIFGWPLLKRVHLPLLYRGILVAGILVFVDVLKEMPLTLMTRPFGWDTLSVRIFEMVSEGEWERAAFPAVILILTGLIPVAVLAKQMRS